VLSKRAALRAWLYLSSYGVHVIVPNRLIRRWAEAPPGVPYRWQFADGTVTPVLMARGHPTTYALDYQAYQAWDRSLGCMIIYRKRQGEESIWQSLT